MASGLLRGLGQLVESYKARHFLIVYLALITYAKYHFVYILADLMDMFGVDPF